MAKSAQAGPRGLTCFNWNPPQQPVTWLWIFLILLEFYFLVCWSRYQRVPLTLTLWFQDVLCLTHAPHCALYPPTTPRLLPDFGIPACSHYLQDIQIELNVPIMLYSSNCTNLRLPLLKWIFGLKKTLLGKEKRYSRVPENFLNAFNNLELAELSTPPSNGNICLCLHPAWAYSSVTALPLLTTDCHLISFGHWIKEKVNRGWVNYGVLNKSNDNYILSAIYWALMLCLSTIIKTY